jgi:hypothetical protein
MKPFLPLVMGILIMGCTGGEQRTASELEKKIDRYAPVRLAPDLAGLTPDQRQIVGLLADAARVMDTLYLIQEWEGNLPLLKRLEAEPTPAGREQHRYFLINMGPWSHLDGNTAFLPGVPAGKPPGANYYPSDMTKEEFDAWVAGLSEPERKAATGFFTVIRRRDDRSLAVVPYNVEYAPLLERAARLLREAARLADPTLKRFLELRADAFLSNNYFDSDVAWMDLDSPIEPTIGPYEVYMDELFNYKAAFEAFITLRNDEETAKLARFSSHLQEIEDHLPIADADKNPSLGTMAPIRVVDQVALGGESRGGVQTAAFNLPNDEQVTTLKGSKRVMLRNVQQAKFQKILMPIAELTIDPGQRQSIAFDPFFTHILAHELMHGLGPHAIKVQGKPTTVRQAMQEIGSALEEAKADVSGLFALQYLIDTGIVPKEMERGMYVTFLASAFRSLRFGVHEAHGRGMALQINYLMAEKAFLYDEASGTFSVDIPRAKGAVAKLTGEIMTLQARGDYAGAKEMLLRLATIPPPVERTLARLSAIPVDIVPVEKEEE